MAVETPGAVVTVKLRGRDREGDFFTDQWFYSLLRDYSEV